MDKLILVKDNMEKAILVKVNIVKDNIVYLILVKLIKVLPLRICI